MTKTTNWHDLPVMLTAADVARVLGLSKPTTYELFARDDFPSVRVSERRLIVGKDKLQQWLDGQAGVTSA
jgi:excisionase family DNA binding protein